MIVFLLIALGLCLGSFVNALVWRLHAHRDWVRERSECTHCHHPLAPSDLIPVLSWVMLGGRCRYCHASIEDTPIPEIVVPFLLVLSYYFWPFPLHGAGLFQFILWAVFIVGFVALALYDIRWYLLPDKIVFPLSGLAVLQVIIVWLGFGGTWRAAAGALVSAVIISGLFYLLYVVSNGRWIGFGDVKLGVGLGLLASGPVRAFLLLFIASLLGLIISLPLIVAGKANRKSHLPFGPLLLAATVIVVLFGGYIVSAYMKLITG